MAVEQADFEPGLHDPPVSLQGLLDVRGRRVDDLGGTRVGSLRDVLVDAESGFPVWGIVKLGRFGRCSAVPAAYLAPGADRVWAALDRDPIRAAASLDPEAGLTVEQERTLLAHYGAADGDRMRELSGRAAEFSASVPAG